MKKLEFEALKEYSNIHFINRKIETVESLVLEKLKSANCYVGPPIIFQTGSPRERERVKGKNFQEFSLSRTRLSVFVSLEKKTPKFPPIQDDL
ncbi:hypothetical protein V6Z11_D06G224600 [Gossypium hirsutum]